MGFSAKQMQSLRRNLNSAHIRTRNGNGRELSYVEAWHAIAEANRIFGFDGWDRETIETRCVFTRDMRGTFVAFYAAKVRITVHANNQDIVREGHGSGEGHATFPAEAHDVALKTAETDATKRALATFGKPFGLSLYLGGGRSRGSANSSDRRPPIAPRHRFSSNSEAKVSIVDSASLPSTGNTEGPPLVASTLKSQIAEPQNEVTAVGRIDKSALLIGEPKRHRDKPHLSFVASQPCLVCGREHSDAHHLRFAQPRALGLKVSDEFVVPLCRIHHRQIHQVGNEMDWWKSNNIDPLPIAKSLWEKNRQGRNTQDATSSS